MVFDTSVLDEAVAQRRAAGRLSMRLGCEVDLVELKHCHFADKIRREGVLWTQLDRERNRVKE